MFVEGLFAEGEQQVGRGPQMGLFLPFYGPKMLTAKMHSFTCMSKPVCVCVLYHLYVLVHTVQQNVQLYNVQCTVEHTYTVYHIQYIYCVHVPNLLNLLNLLTNI